MFKKYCSVLLDATWEAWRKAEGGPAAQNPSIRVAIDVDHISLDLRPSDMAALARIYDAVQEVMYWTQ
ncbi:jg2442, partial [Pararge aegeria aegeria]